MPENIQRKIKRSVIFWSVALVALAADLLSKSWTLKTLAPEIRGFRGPIVSVIPGLLRLEYAENTGAAFSLFENHPEILTIVASALALGIMVWGILLPQGERLSRIALGMVLGGAVGNLVDRFRFGYVVDFIQLHWQGQRIFPTFNIADSAICVGIVLYFIATWLVPLRSRPESPAEKAGNP